MTFETGGDMQDPFQETENQDNETEPEVNHETEEESLTTEPETDFTDSTANKTMQDSEFTESRLDTESESTTSTSQAMESEAQIPYVKDLDVTQSQSPTRLAQALMMPAYHDENPPVPYSVWRDGTSTGRGRTTIELNDDVDELVKQAMREFNSRYDADINKADIREFALAYGLAHLDEVFSMAEEWGIQYNS